jgi:hypothetical protein
VIKQNPKERMGDVESYEEGPSADVESSEEGPSQGVKRNTEEKPSCAHTGQKRLKHEVCFRVIPETSTDSTINTAFNVFHKYYDKLIPFSRTDEGNFYMNEPLDRENPAGVGYLFCGRSNKRIDDDAFLIRPLELYGLHTYGGYYGFFRPDIIEALWLLLDTEDGLQKLKDCKKVYVTTEMYPSDNIRECYHRGKDRHQGKTLFYFV